MYLRSRDKESSGRLHQGLTAKITAFPFVILNPSIDFG